MCKNKANVYPIVYPILFFIPYIYDTKILSQWQAYQLFTEKIN